MSTKCTLGHGEHYHLYAECFENDNVWLQFAYDKAEVTLSTRAGKPTVQMAIPIADWRALVAGWLESPWANDPARDGQPVEVGIEAEMPWSDPE